MFIKTTIILILRLPGFGKLVKDVMELSVCIEFYIFIIKYFHYAIAGIFLELIINPL